MAQVLKNLPAKAGDVGDISLIPGARRSPGGGNGNPLIFLPGKSHGQRSLAGYSPWGCKESDMTEHVCTHSIYTFQQGFKHPLGIYAMELKHCHVTCHM